MIKNIIGASMGLILFDYVIENVKIVNVLTNEIYKSDIGIKDGFIVNISDNLKNFDSKNRYDGKGKYAVPGYIDCHMHLESSMMIPSEFSSTVIPLGTVNVIADPHEIANVFGKKGVIAINDACSNIPLKVDLMAPSTVPSAPNFENSGAEITADDIAILFDEHNLAGLGEVMDFNGVVSQDSKMTSIIKAARDRKVIIDGHSSILKGQKLQAFIASGINSDHTIMTPEVVTEKLRNGMWVQIQDSFITPELIQFLNNFPVQDRIMIVTDDVSVGKLNNKGHLNYLLKKAVSYGLDPLKAIRYVTVNPASRMMKQYSGIISPGAIADVLLLDNLVDFTPSEVFIDGVLVSKNGKMLIKKVDSDFSSIDFNSINMNKTTSSDFIIRDDNNVNSKVSVNVIRQDGATTRTKHEVLECACNNGIIEQGNLMKMTVFNRYSGNNEHFSGLISNIGHFKGALATTYAHDCHNLVVYSSNDEDASLAANKLITSGGGIVAFLNGVEIGFLSLPIGGILSKEDKNNVFYKYNHIEKIVVEKMGLKHEAPLSFITLMALAVSPDIKLTDMGLLDVVGKKFIPIVNVFKGKN